MKAAILICCLSACNALVWPIDSKGVPVPGSIRTFFMNPVNLWKNRELYQQGYRQLNPAVNRVIRRCTGALRDNNTYAVTAKTGDQAAPSNNIHDYYSLARYFWPNASAPNGLPYMRADGYINPEIYLIPDPAYVSVMFDDIQVCSLAYFFSGNETYARVATKRIRDWFLDPNTYMSPNLQFANWVKGTPLQIATGNTSGISVSSQSGGLLGTNALLILDFVKMPFLIDSIGLLVNSKSFTQSDYQGMAKWLGQYLDWLKTSSRGVSESQSPNNQGTWYDVQAVSIMLFLGQSEEAGNHIAKNTLPRMVSQFLPDGSQPLEQARTLSWLYSCYNLKALFYVSFLAQSTKVNLFQYQDDQGRSLVKGLNYLIPYATTNGTNWPVQNLGDYDANTVIELSKLAYVIYRDNMYIETVNVLQNGIPKTSNIFRLWSPYMAFDNIRSSAKSSKNALGVIILSLGLVFIL